MLIDHPILNVRFDVDVPIMASLSSSLTALTNRRMYVTRLGDIEDFIEIISQERHETARGSNFCCRDSVTRFLYFKKCPRYSKQFV